MKAGTRVEWDILFDPDKGSRRRGKGTVVESPDGAFPQAGFVFVKKDRGRIGLFRLTELREIK